MSLRSKLIITSILLIIIPLFIVTIVLSMYIKEDAISKFTSSSISEIEKVDKGFEFYLEGVRSNLAMLSKAEQIQGISGQLKNYTQVQNIITNDENITAQELSFKKTLRMVKSSNDSYDYLFLGTEKGEFVMVPDGELGSNYDPRKRGWYQQGLKVDSFDYTDAYRSTTGDVVISIVLPVYNNGNKFGVLGVDLTLKKLTDVVENVKFGKTGFVALVQKNGVILANPRAKNDNFKKIEESTIREVAALGDEKTEEMTFEGKKYLAIKYTSPKSNFLFYALKEKSEIFEATYTLYRMALTLGIVISVIFVIIAYKASSNLSNSFMDVANSMQAASKKLEGVAKQMEDTSFSLSETSHQQASSIQETSASLEELTGMVENNVNNANLAQSQATSIKDLSQEANQSSTELNQSMNLVLQKNLEFEELIAVINNIKDKTRVMDEIAFQTKLLSFNASVEAERAGEHGRGFAVVAQEVGSLAELSAKAAREIGHIVATSLEQTTTIIRDSQKTVEGSKSIVEKVVTQLKTISDKALEVERSGREVYQASHEQSKGITQINQAMHQLETATQNTSTTSHISAQNAKILKEEMEELDHMVDTLVKIVSAS